MGVNRKTPGDGAARAIAVLKRCQYKGRVSSGSRRTSIGALRLNFLPKSETFIFTSLTALQRQFDVRAFCIKQMHQQRFPFSDVTSLRAGCFGWMEAAFYRTTTVSPRLLKWARTIDIVHAHMGQCGVHGLWVARKTGKPLVTSYYGKDVTILRSLARFSPSFWHYTALARKLFEVGDRFLVLSNQMQSDLVAQGCPAQKIRIVRLGVDLSRFVGAKRTAKPTCTVLMVGREVEKKGFADGLQACAEARRRGADLQVVMLGTGGPLQSMLAALAQQLKESAGLQVQWLDPSTSVAQTMVEADILLVPSKTARNGDAEGTPTVICEGSASELPIVSTRHAGIPEQVEHGITGLLSDEGDVEGLASHLVELAADAERRHAFGAAGRAKMIADWSITAHAESLAKVYAELV